MLYRPRDGGTTLTFAEVAFELADARHAFCRLTRGPGAPHIVYRTLDTGEMHRRHRALISFRGTPEAGSELVREVRAGRAEATIELVHQGERDTSFIVETPVETGLACGLASLPGVLAEHRLIGLIDPVVASEGRVFVRIVVPRQVDPQEVLRALQEIPRACGFAEFRIQRIGSIAPVAHVGAARRALPPEQEALLALAASMGYYETPKIVTLEEIARAVGLSISPVHKRLKAAEEAIVGQHVAPVAIASARPRRGRPTLAALEPPTPGEILVRVRGEVGPATFLSQAPDARASLHVLSTEAGRTQAALFVLVAAEEVQTKLLAAMEDRPEIIHSQIVERTAQHVVCRLVTRDRGPYALGWWGDSWGPDAMLRSLVFEGGETHVRGLLTRPMAPERIQQRLQECAHAAGWSDWELVALRSLASGPLPAAWPEPLTQRQLEVLRVAHALGYYQTPRGCTLEHVAQTLGVSANAIHKNLVLAESKLIAGYLAGSL